MSSPDSIPAAIPAPAVIAGDGGRSAPKRVSAFRVVPWRLSDIVIGLAVLLAWRLAASLGREWLISHSVWVYWALYLIPPEIWMLLFPIWIAKRRSSAALLVTPGMNKLFKEVALAPLSWVALLICVVAALTPAVLIFGERVLPGNSFYGIEGSRHLASSVGYLVIAMSVGPVSEELFFRGFLYNALRRHCPAFVALILQAFVFGSMHAFGIMHSVFAFLLGIGLALIYDWRKTLLAPILVHWLQDSVAVVRAALVMIAALNAPHLGVNGTTADRGILIDLVQPGTTAEEIGLRKGDIIAKFDGQTVREIGELSKLVRQRQVGDPVDIEVIRDGRTILIKASLQHTLRH